MNFVGTGILKSGEDVEEVLIPEEKAEKNYIMNGNHSHQAKERQGGITSLSHQLLLHFAYLNLRQNLTINYYHVIFPLRDISNHGQLTSKRTFSLKASGFTFLSFKRFEIYWFPCPPFLLVKNKFSIMMHCHDALLGSNVPYICRLQDSIIHQTTKQRIFYYLCIYISHFIPRVNVNKVILLYLHLIPDFAVKNEDAFFASMTIHTNSIHYKCNVTQLSPLTLRFGFIPSYYAMLYYE